MGQRGRGDPGRRGERGRTGPRAAVGAGHADGEHQVSSPEEQRLFVGGEWVAPDGGHYAVVDPATEETVGWAPEASRDQVHAACAAAREAFGPWSRTPAGERAGSPPPASAPLPARPAPHALTRAGRAPYAGLAQAETGATTATARAMQVGVAAARFRRYAQVEPAEWA